MQILALAAVRADMRFVLLKNAAVDERSGSQVVRVKGGLLSIGAGGEKNKGLGPCVRCSEQWFDDVTDI